MPAIFINPNTEEHINLLAQLKQQNQDLRVFVSDKKEKDYIEKLQGKKAIGDIYDDSHIYTASEGAFCGIFYEGSDKSLRDVFIKSIKQSSLKRILWISFINETNEITNIENLIYILCKSDTDYEDTILRLEEVDHTEEKFIDLS
tara:strand:- start:7959 stop:8393 length:435 start_codon:yes stop_codon:yes gene_type:complete